MFEICKSVLFIVLMIAAIFIIWKLMLVINREAIKKDNYHYCIYCGKRIKNNYYFMPSRGSNNLIKDFDIMIRFLCCSDKCFYNYHEALQEVLKETYNENN